MPRIFISYSRKDLGFVRRLAGDLEKAGYEVWWDPGDVQAGDDWTDPIPVAIRSSDYFIPVLSSSSAQSEWVENEYTQALALHKKIIPVMLERSQSPFALNAINYVDFTSANYAANLNALLTALGYAGELPARPKPLSMPFSPLVYAVPILIGIILVLWLVLTPIFIAPIPPTFTPSPIPSKTAVLVTVPIVVPGDTLTPTGTSTPIDTGTPTGSATAVVCIPESALPIYIVQPGDTLLSIARATKSTVAKLMHINCLAESSIYSGQVLYVPRSPIETGTAPYNLPNPTETPDALQTLQSAFKEVDQQFQEMLRANIAYNVPQRMKLDETIDIELLLKPSLYQEELATQIVERSNFLTSTAEVGQLVTQIVEERGLITSTAELGKPVTEQGQEVDVVTGDVIITPRMKAVLRSLKSGAFEIQELHDHPEQPISSLEATKWRWSVTAKEPGEQTLELVISRLIKQGDNEYWREVEAYRADISVQVTPAQRIRSLDWKWIFGILLTALLIPLFFRWYDTRRKEPNEPKPPAPPKRKSRKK